MQTFQANQLLMVYGNKLPLASFPMVRERLEQLDDQMANMLLAQLKDPTVSLVLSILLGAYGIDRIYIGEVGLGILKLLTCGGLGVWWLIDLFLIMERTRENNLNQFMTPLHP